MSINIEFNLHWLSTEVHGIHPVRLFNWRKLTVHLHAGTNYR